MPSIQALSFENHLKGVRSGKAAPAPVYTFAGTDASLLSTCVAGLRAAIEADDRPGSMVTDLEDPPSPSTVFDELRTQPFMGMAGLRLVIVRKGAEFLAANGPAVAQYAQKPSSSGVLALCCESLDRRTAAAKAVEKAGLVVDCNTPSWRDARSWLIGEAGRLGCSIAPPAAQALLEAIGPNVTALQTELEKLSLYVGDGGAITEAEVEELVPAGRSRSIFELGDAIAGRKTATALRLVEGLLLRGDRPEQIIPSLGHQVRRLWRLRQLLAAGMRREEIGHAIGMPDFAIRKSEPLVNQLSDRWFAQRIALLSKADEELKTTSLPARDHLVWLSGLVAALCR